MGNEVFQLLLGERGVGLQPQGKDACHTGCRHGSSGIGTIDVTVPLHFFEHQRQVGIAEVVVVETGGDMQAGATDGGNTHTVERGAIGTEIADFAYGKGKRLIDIAVPLPVDSRTDEGAHGDD